MNHSDLVKRSGGRPVQRAVRRPRAAAPARPHDCGCRRPRAHQLALDGSNGPPWRIRVSNRYCIGDAMGAAMAVESLHQAYPGEYLTHLACRGGHELLAGCPWQQPAGMVGYAIDLRHGTYEQRLGTAPMRMADAYCHELATAIKRPLACTVDRPPVWWSDSEQAWRPSVTGEYAVVQCGYKQHDFTSKFPGMRCMQAVTDSLLARGLAVVQVGAAQHTHPRLAGAIDLVGQTSLRELLLWIRHARLVCCNISFPMWAAAAVGTPAVAVNGGREHTCWTRLPGVTHVSRYTCGGPCGASLVQPVAAGEVGSNWNHRACTRPVEHHGETLPQCMAELEASGEVIRACSAVLDGAAYIPLEVL